MTVTNEKLFSDKTAYYSQVEAQASTKRETENVRHYALKVQHLVGKYGCSDSPAAISFRCNKISTQGWYKKLKDSAHKRLVAYTTLLWSHPFHFTHWLNLLMLEL